MVLKILLVISIILQIVTAGMAIRLIRTTKFNSTWIFFTVALTLMVVQLLSEFINSIGKDLVLPKDFLAWTGVITSLCFALGVFFVRKIIKYISQIEKNRRLTEKRILNTIISTEEKERRRFSKDLHDGLGPLLSSVKMSVSALSKMNIDPTQKEIIENADYVIGEAIKSLKEISNNLSPHILNNFGVSRAVNNFINKLTLPSKMSIKFNTNLKGDRFSNNVEAILYRVVCELVNNAIKHSNATLITVSMMLDGDNMTLTVEDNGKGFDDVTFENSSKNGMGLSNIASRISSLKGFMDVANLSRGAKVQITVNVNQ